MADEHTLKLCTEPQEYAEAYRVPKGGSPMSEERSGQPSCHTGPENNVPQERVQNNPNWDSGGEKTPSQDQEKRHWEQVDDDNRNAGGNTPTTGTPDAPAPSASGEHDRNPSTYGGLEGGLPASGATTHPDRQVDGEERS